LKIGIFMAAVGLLLMAELTSASAETASPASPHSPDPIAAASAAMEAGQFQRAEALWHTALSRHPRDSDALGRLGMVYLAQHRMREAFAALQVAQALNPEDPITLLRLARLYRQAKFVTRERQTLIKAIRLRPDLPAAHRRLAQMLTETHAYFAASAEYAWLIQHGGARPAPEVVHNLALVYERLGYRKAAADQLRRYLTLGVEPEAADRARVRIERLSTPPGTGMASP